MQPLYATLETALGTRRAKKTPFLMNAFLPLGSLFVIPQHHLRVHRPLTKCPLQDIEDSEALNLGLPSALHEKALRQFQAAQQMPPLPNYLERLPRRRQALEVMEHRVVKP